MNDSVIKLDSKLKVKKNHWDISKHIPKKYKLEDVSVVMILLMLLMEAMSEKTTIIFQTIVMQLTLFSCN